MFEWCRGSALREMIDRQVPGVACDDWLEGWMFGMMQSRLQFEPPLAMLDIRLGEGARPYLETYQQQGATVQAIDAEALSQPECLVSHEARYDLVTLLSLEREQCLERLDLDDPLQLIESLLSAAKLLNAGGALVWSYLYCFSSDPNNVRSLLEPAAIYQSLIRRGLQPLWRADNSGTGRVAIYHDSDTLFVRHGAILGHADQYERVTRVCGGVRRSQAASRVNVASSNT